MMYKLYCPHKGFYQATGGNGYIVDAGATDATVLPLAKAQAAIIFHDLKGVVLIPIDFEGVPAHELMAMAGTLMQAATAQANTAIAPMARKGANCPQCSEGTIGRRLRPMTNPAQYYEGCDSCGHEVS